MADPRRPVAARLVMTLAAVAATVCGWFAMAARESSSSSSREGGEAQLAPIPTLEPGAGDVAPSRAARRPRPVAVTRSSR